MNNFTQQMGIFGLGCSFLEDIRLVTDSKEDVSIFNSGIGFVLFQQLGITLYPTSNQGLA